MSSETEGSKFAEKFGDLPFNVLERPSQSIRDWDQLGISKFLERYLSNRLCLAVKARKRTIENEPEIFCAFFADHAPVRIAEDHVRDCGEWLAHAQSSRQLKIYVKLDDVTEACSRGHQQKQPMFIDVIGVIQPGQHVVVGRCVVVGLRFLDQISSARTHAFYTSTFTSAMECLPVFFDRKEMMSPRRSSVSDDQRGYEVIEAGTQMVNDLAGEHGDVMGNPARPLDTKDVFAGIVLEVADNFVSARFEKSNNLGFEMVDCLVCPLDLNSNGH